MLKIDIDPGSQSSFISDDVKLEIGLPIVFDGCENEPVPIPLSWDDIRPYCKDKNRYDPTAVENKLAIEEKENFIQSFEVNPVPSSGKINLSFSLKRQEKVSLVLYDLSGRKIMVIQESTFLNEGEHVIPSDISQLASGVYIATLETEDTRQSIRVVRQ